jgi:hypothetical protein
MKKETKINVASTEKKIKTALFTYTMKVVIPTGVYENIQPEITMQGTNLDEMKDFLMAHIESIKAQYGVNRDVSANGITVAMPKVTLSKDSAPKKEVAQSSYEIAQQRVSLLDTKEALLLLQTKIEISQKLTAEEKELLIASIKEKVKGLESA